MYIHIYILKRLKVDLISRSPQEDSNPKSSIANNKIYDLHSTHHNYESAETLVLEESFINNKWRFLKNDSGKKTH